MDPAKHQRPLPKTLTRVWQSLQRRWRRSPLGVKGLAIALILILMGRSLPYLAPIRLVDVTPTSQAMEFRDRNGLPLGTILSRDQNHTVTVPLEQVSPHFIQAIIAAEDARFYHHGAIDSRAIVRAILEAIQARQIVSGGSTITMQLARMIDPAPPSIPNKLREIWTSWRLTAGLSRDEILQTYINRLPMGGNIYGVEAAARLYFGTPARDLTLAQATLLAAIPNDPNRLNPYSHRTALNQRQAYVLSQLVKHGTLEHPQADQIAQEIVTFQPRSQGIIAAPHFLFWLASHLSRAPHLVSPIQTTLDRPLQQFVENQVQQVIQTLSPQNVHHAAALVIDNRSQSVLAYVGSPQYFATGSSPSDADSQGQNDGVQALRQPGSTLKPFLYQLALENRTIRSNTILADVPTRYAIPGAKLYNPTDYSEHFQGPVRVRIALANSLNIPAVRVLEKVTVPVFLDRLHRLGFNHLTHPPDYYGLGLTLGSGEVSLWELARAYLTLAHPNHSSGLPDLPDLPDLKVLQDGALQDSALQDSALQFKIQHSKFPASSAHPFPQKLKPSSKVPANQGARDQSQNPTAALITDMLSDRHARAQSFGVNSLLSLPFPAAVKTGTSSDFRDTWTVGFTRDYTVAVWVGNFDGDPMQKVSGVTGAAPLWNRIMLHLHEGQEPLPFDAPSGFVQRPICALSGARPGPGCAAIAQEYVALGDLEEYARQPDPFYQTGSLQLPAEYDEWLATQTTQASGNLHSLGDRGKRDGPGSNRIVSPRPGDLFYIDGQSDGPSHPAQKLEFKLAAAPTAVLEWRLNGQLLATQSTNSLFWTAKPGIWTLQVSPVSRDSKGNPPIQEGQRDQVQFEVQVAAAKASRRGFSFGDRSRTTPIK
jgi:penicillin-binding protein 1C